MNKPFCILTRGVGPFLLFVVCACGTGSGTVTNGPVSILTDRTTYAPTDSIRVSVANHLQSSIFSYDTRASCTILGLQVQVSGTWHDTTVARCSLGRPSMLVAIPAGQVYTATISAGSPGVSQTTFPPGTYRLLLSYSTSATQGPPAGGAGITNIYSAAFQVVPSVSA